MAQDDVILSPKNLYRMLASRDRRGGGVFDSERLKGVTLVRFWRELLSGVLPAEVMEGLFPLDGTHPRSQSSLMNRSGTTAMPTVLRRQLSETLSIATLLQMTCNAMHFLLSHHYHPVNYPSVLDEFENVCFSNDLFMTEPIQRLLLNLRATGELGENQTKIEPLIRDGYRLAWLALLALHGPEMGCDAVTRLRMDSACSLPAIQQLLQPSQGSGSAYEETLPSGAQRLLRLLALLLNQPWRPEELLPYAMDITGRETELSRLLSLLHAIGWLMKNDMGYTLPPVIAENERLKGYTCDEFPLLWQDWRQRLDDDVNELKQQLYQTAMHALACTDELNRDGLKVLLQLEGSAMTRSTSDMKPALLQLHQHYLDTHAHTLDDEASLLIMRLLWATLLGDAPSFAACTKKLLDYPNEVLLQSDYYGLLLNVLESGGNSAERSDVDALFERLKPTDGHQLVKWLNFCGGKERSVNRQPDKALLTLREGRRLIEKLGLQGSIEEAANDTRMAYALADQLRWPETLPLIRRVLANLEARGYAPDSRTMESTRNAYNFFLGKCEDYQQAKQRMKEDISSFEGRTEAKDNYLRGLTNYLDLLLDNLETEEAAEAAARALQMCREDPDLPASVVSGALRSCARLSLRKGQPAEALGLLTWAMKLGDAYYHEETRFDQSLRYWTAECLLALNRAKEAKELLLETKANLEKFHEEDSELYANITARLKRLE